MSMDKRKESVYACLGTVVMYVQRKKKRHPTMTNDNTYISCEERTLAIVRFFPKTFSNSNQLVARFLKLFGSIWKNLMSVKTIFSVSNNKKRKQKKKIYTLVSENDKKDIQPKNV